MKDKKQSLTIGKLAEISGISTDTIRYYEKMKLLPATGRTKGGYRLYEANAVEILQFIRGAKALNFTLEEIRELLTLEASDQGNCADVLKRTKAKILEAETKIKELKEVQKILERLIGQCPGDESPLECCPILGHIKNTAKSAIIVFTIIFCMAQVAQAKPLSYPGGLMFMQENDETGHTLSLDYTISPKHAVALYAKKEEGGENHITAGPQLNTLIKRWNLPHGQGNIFNMTGVGVSHEKDDDDFAVWTSFLADYETRRIFISYEPRIIFAGDIDKSFSQRGRVGFAPYLANYDDLNTWLMVQVDHHPMKEDTFVVTPLVRFFYKTTLVEAGYSSNNQLMFNWQLQF